MNRYISKDIIKRFKSYIEIAKALKGSKQTGRAFHVTVACFKKKVLAIGVNNYSKAINKTKFGKYNVYGESTYQPCLHSEVSALLKLGREDCSNIEFFNIRIDNNNNIATSKPCNNCFNTLSMVGYKHIYYINSFNKIEVI